MREEFFCQLKKASNKILLMSLKKNYILLLILFTSLNGICQFNQAAQIFERSDYFHVLNGNPVTASKIPTVLNLMDGVNPAIYVSNGHVNTYGQVPVCLFSDLASISLPIILNVQKSNIEIVTIKLETPSQLNSIIDLAAFSSYKRLKYIYFRIGFDMEISQLAQAIKNSKENYVIIYSVDKGA